MYGVRMLRSKTNYSYEAFFRPTTNDQRPTFFAAEKRERKDIRRGGMFKKFNMFKRLTYILPLALSVEHSAFERLRAFVVPVFLCTMSDVRCT